MVWHRAKDRQQKTDNRRRRSEVRDQKSEDSIKTEVGSQRSDVRGQHKDRGRRSEIKSQRTA